MIIIYFREKIYFFMGTHDFHTKVWGNNGDITMWCIVSTKKWDAIIEY